MTDLVTLRHLIGGERLAGKVESSLRNPSDLSDTVTELLIGGTSEVDAAVFAARQAFNAWSGTSPLKRSDLLFAIAGGIRAHKARLASELSREEGKLLADAKAEATKAAQVFEFYAGQALRLDGEFGSRLAADADVIVTREPLGVIGLITPWNAPLAIVSWKLAPALMMGNAVVLKPSERAPVCVQSLIDIVLDAVMLVGAPVGLINMVHGAVQAGSALSGHAGIDALSFTGGTVAGRHIAVSVAARLLPVQLELGGKNPFVVSADADLETAISLVMFGAFAGAGQKCTATSRIIVETAVADAFIDKLTKKVSKFTVGRADALDVDMGPVISAASKDNVATVVRDAIAAGAEQVAMGHTVARSVGHFAEPVLLLDDDSQSWLNQNEVFGPVATIIRVADLDEAIAIANGTPFGLSSAIATQSLKTARRFRRQSRAGIVAINQATSGSDLHAPFEGIGQSGFGGAEQGAQAPHFFSRNKTAYVTG
ncbi:MAG: aldehyde dehydrogenase [Sphingomonadales bacterium]|nr:aldehyde dehydrogenase [Sphingomonadales bacterium]